MKGMIVNTGGGDASIRSDDDGSGIITPTFDGDSKRKEDSVVREARKGLLKVMLEHNFVLPRFRSTPLDSGGGGDNMDVTTTSLTADRTSAGAGTDTTGSHTDGRESVASDPSLTSSERAYLEKLLRTGDTARMQAARARLQDASLFFKSEPITEASDADATETSKETPSNSPGIGEEEAIRATGRRQPSRNSAVQQQLFKWHETAEVRPSFVLEQMKQRQRQRMSLEQRNSILDSSDDMRLSNNSLLLQPSNSLVAPDANIEDEEQALEKHAVPVARDKDKHKKSGKYDHIIDDEGQGQQNTAAAFGNDQDNANNEHDHTIMSSATARLGEGEDHGKMAAAESAQITISSSSSRQRNEGAALQELSSWLYGNQGIEVDDQGEPITTETSRGASPQHASVPVSADHDDDLLDHDYDLSALARPMSPPSASPFRILGTSADDVSCHPHVLSPPLMESLLAFVPEALVDCNYWLKYSLVRDGANLWTMLRQVRSSHATILALETDQGHVFGCYTGQSWRLAQGWYGSPDAFLWKMRRSRLETTSSLVQQAVQESEVQVFPFRPGNVAVQYCSKEGLMLGRGEILPAQATASSPTRVGDGKPDAAILRKRPVAVATQFKPPPPPPPPGKHYGHALYLEPPHLLSGTTSTSETFGNPCLVDPTQRGAKFHVVNLEVWTLTPHRTVEEAQQSELSTLFLEGATARAQKDLNVFGILSGGPI